MKRVLCFVMVLVLLCGMLCGCEKEPECEKYSSTFINVFDTVISVISYQPSKEAFDEMSAYIKLRYKQLNELYDIYNDYEGINNIKTINDNAGIAPVEVSEDIINLLLFAKQRYTLTDGRTNVAMGAVIALWHNSREEYEHGIVMLPDEQRLSEAAAHCNIDDVIIDMDNNTVYLADPYMSLDVGAVAKGYATEVICDELNEKYDNYAISAGGNVKTHGHPKDGRERWGVAITNPAVDENFEMLGGSIDTAFFNTDLSLVCSGGYQRYMVVDGVRYNHIINPDTLYPEEIYQGVAVICEDSGMGDCLSTALFIMQPQDAVKLVESMDNTECVLVMADGEIIYSSGVGNYLASFGVNKDTK